MRKQIDANIRVHSLSDLCIFAFSMNELKIKPLNDRVVLEPLKEEEKTKTGLYLPETADKEKSEQGKVLAVGPGKRNDKGELVPVSVKPGDTVIFGGYHSKQKVGDREYYIIPEEDILAILE